MHIHRAWAACGFMRFFSSFVLVLQRMHEESLGRKKKNTAEDELLTRVRFRVWG